MQSTAANESQGIAHPIVSAWIGRECRPVQIGSRPRPSGEGPKMQRKGVRNVTRNRDLKTTGSGPDQNWPETIWPATVWAICLMDRSNYGSQFGHI